MFDDLNNLNNNLNPKLQHLIRKKCVNFIRHDSDNFSGETQKSPYKSNIVR